MKHLNRLTVFLAILLLGYSCVSDDMSDCPVESSSILLEFSYTKNTTNNDAFPQEVDFLHVTLYNNNDDSYVTHYNVAQSTLDKGYILPIDELPDGNYTVVTWAKNTNTDYSVENYTSYKQNMHTELLYPTGQVSPTIGNLFHGITQLNIQDGNGKSVVDLTKNTSELTIRLEEPTATTSRPIALGDYSIEITASNGSYQYDNTLAAIQPQLAYIQSYSVPTFDVLESKGKMLRLYPGDDSQILIKDAQGNIIPILDEQNQPTSNPVPLTAQIMRNPLINTQDDLDRRDNFTLTYSISRNTTTGELNISLIGIDDWTVNSGNPGI